MDGDGRQVKTEETTWNEELQTDVTETKYYLRSSVLGGQVLTELGETGVQSRTFVYAGRAIMAWQWGSFGSESVDWEHKDPSGASVRRGGVGQELDPTGADAGTNAQTIIPDEGALISSGSSYNAANPSITYSVDGIRVPAGDFMAFAGRALQDSLLLMEYFARRTERPIIAGSVLHELDERRALIEYYQDLEDRLSFDTKGIPNLSLLPQNSTWPEPGAQPSPRGFPCPPDFVQILRGGAAVTDKLKQARELGPKTGREQGGWIYMNKQGKLKANLKEGGGSNVAGLGMAIDLWHPPILKGWIVIADFHTHDIDSEPSMPTGETVSLPNDLWNNEWKGVPGIILGPDATTGYGPKRGYWGQHGKMPKKCQK